MDTMSQESSSESILALLFLFLFAAMKVIHAGIYYEKDSHKAKLCVEGKKLLYDYCERKGISHRRIGKLIVSPRSQDSTVSENALRDLQAKADSNGVHDLRILSSDEVRIRKSLCRLDSKYP